MSSSDSDSDSGAPQVKKGAAKAAPAQGKAAAAAALEGQCEQQCARAEGAKEAFRTVHDAVVHRTDGWEAQWSACSPVLCPPTAPLPFLPAGHRVRVQGLRHEVPVHRERAGV